MVTRAALPTFARFTSGSGRVQPARATGLGRRDPRRRRGGALRRRTNAERPGRRAPLLVELLEGCVAEVERAVVEIEERQRLRQERVDEARVAADERRVPEPADDPARQG